MKLAGFYLVLLLLLFSLSMSSASAEEGASRATSKVFIEPAAKLTLQDAIQAALANNHDVSAALHEINARESAASQEGLLRNPTFFSEFEEFGGTGDFSGDDVLGTTVGISQEIQLAGKRTKRRHVAEHETRIARLELQAKILSLTSDVKKKFLRVHFLEQGLLLEKENIALLQDALNVVSRQISLGDISPLDERKAIVELALAKASLARSQRELDMARVELASSWGSTEVSFDQVEFVDQKVQPLPSINDLWQTALNHPEIQIRRTQVERLKASYALAKAEAVPDLEIEGGVQYFNESDDHAFFVGISIPIPVFDQNRGGIREASANIKVGEKELDSNTLSIRTELSMLLGRLQILEAERATTETTLIPAAFDAYEALKRAYQAGEKEYLELLDSQRTLLEVRRGNLLLEMEYHETITDLEKIAGIHFKSFSQNYSGLGEQGVHNEK
ncbi:MAG: TolC family protein [Desulfobulbaceae bacterium]|nr:TolC family protein [Desulfobulbaceae bacterium]